MSSVEIRQKKRTISDRIADFFRRKKSNVVHPTFFQTMDRGNDLLNLTSSFRMDSPVEQKDISTAAPESVIPTWRYSDISISAMIDILEETRARKTFSSTTFTIKKDKAPSSVVSLEESSSAWSLEGCCVPLEENRAWSLAESRSVESVEQTLVSQFRLELSDTSGSVDGDTMSWFELLQ
jgi:hypothetical protein